MPRSSAAPTFPVSRLFLSRCLRIERPARERRSSSPDQRQHKEKNDRADRGVNDGSDESRPNMDTQYWEQVTGDDRAQNSDDDIADQTKASALDNEARDPAS